MKSRKTEGKSGGEVLYQPSICLKSPTPAGFSRQAVCLLYNSGIVLTPFHSTPILTSSPVSEPLSYLTLVRLSLLLRLSPSASFRISTTRVWWMGSMPCASTKGIRASTDADVSLWKWVGVERFMGELKGFPISCPSWCSYVTVSATNEYFKWLWDGSDVRWERWKLYRSRQRLTTYCVALDP